PRADRGAAASSRDRPCAGRRGVRRGAEPAIRVRCRSRPAAAPGGPPAAAARGGGARRVANPLSADEPLLRTTLLPGLLRVLARNAGRGFSDVALFEMGLVFRPRPESPGIAPILRVDRGPTEQEVASLEAALPDQPLRVAAVLAGDRELPGWWGPGRPAAWPDIIEAAREVLRVSGVPFEVRSDQHEPWHPGRCAALFVQAADGPQRLAGHAGELHPRVTAAFDLAPRTCAMELDLTVVETAG